MTWMLTVILLKTLQCQSYVCLVKKNLTNFALSYKSKRRTPRLFFISITFIVKNIVKQNRLCVSVAVLRMLRGLLGEIATCCIPPNLLSWCRSFATRKNGTTSPCLRRNMLKVHIDECCLIYYENPTTASGPPPLI